ncbi:MAG TPA: polynucleotide kinase-phosphatase [Solirubrobacterales bacterium]|jgi:protein phosphatase|nr:polynucleotide kinase-phosphatase [Solirubrobacterales bacterium]
MSRGAPKTIDIPDPSLVVLVGASGSGKSSFAARHFAPTEIISSDFCRGLVADDENDQAATPDAFAVLNFIAAKRLEQPRLTVIDATNVQRSARKPLLELAREHDLFAVAIVLDLPESVCQERNRSRPDRDFGPHVVRQQRSQMKGAAKKLRREGFHRVWVLDSPEVVDAVELHRTPLWTDRRGEHGPFDIIGDVHGCHTELVALLGELGYRVGEGGLTAKPPTGRRAIFVGDYCDRGPDTPAVLRLVMSMAAAGDAICLPGNHDVKLSRALKGRDVKIAHGLDASLAQLESESTEFRDEVADFLRGLVSHVVLDDGRLVVAHAGMKEAYQGRSSARVRDFALFGETTGETDEYGLQVRVDWAADYRGRAAVVYGHTTVLEPEWVNETIDIDTGCVFGGRLTALRWPERELISVAAARTYYESERPPPTVVPPEEVGANGSSADGERPPFLLDVEDVAGRRVVETRLARTVSVREENAAAALEVMSRFAIDPRWLVYLPPTMAPCATSREAGVLERPEQAFEEYEAAGVREVICEEKHMGSRAIVVVCRDGGTARHRFGVDAEETGAIYTRTGRPFFDAAVDREAALARVREAVAAAGLWEELGTDWLVLDCELLPWSAKAIGLIREQYASVGAAARAGLSAAITTLERGAGRGLDVTGSVDVERHRLAHVERYTDAYRRYVWPVEGIADLRLAPFHILAGEGHAFVERDHAWHLERIDRLVAATPGWLRRTDRRTVELGDVDSRAAAIAWWEEMTDEGGEGMVVKPASFVAQGKRGTAQPGIKVRGPEYLRIIYGPEYLEPSQLDRLRDRNLGRKRSLAVREFGLGVEALERLARAEPLYRIHECVFGVLALESEPVDPRL